MSCELDTCHLTGATGYTPIWHLVSEGHKPIWHPKFSPEMDKYLYGIQSVKDICLYGILFFHSRGVGLMGLARSKFGFGLFALVLVLLAQFWSF